MISSDWRRLLVWYLVTTQVIMVTEVEGAGAGKHRQQQPKQEIDDFVRGTSPPHTIINSNNFHSKSYAEKHRDIFEHIIESTTLCSETELRFNTEDNTLENNGDGMFVCCIDAYRSWVNFCDLSVFWPNTITCKQVLEDNRSDDDEVIYRWECESDKSWIYATGLDCGLRNHNRDYCPTEEECCATFDFKPSVDVLIISVIFIVLFCLLFSCFVFCIWWVRGRFGIEDILAVDPRQEPSGPLYSGHLMEQGGVAVGGLRDRFANAWTTTTKPGGMIDKSHGKKRKAKDT